MHDVGVAQGYIKPSALSCPHLCPRYLEHGCGHVVVDKPTEIRPRRGRRHRNWMYPRGVYRNRWSRASVHIVMSNSPNHACSISNGARRIPPWRTPPVVSLYPRSHPARRPPSNDPRSKLFSLFVLLGCVTLGIRSNSPCDPLGIQQGCPLPPLPSPLPPRVGALALPSSPGGLAEWLLTALSSPPNSPR